MQHIGCSSLVIPWTAWNTSSYITQLRYQGTYYPDVRARCVSLTSTIEPLFSYPLARAAATFCNKSTRISQPTLPNSILLLLSSFLPSDYLPTYLFLGPKAFPSEPHHCNQATTRHHLFFDVVRHGESHAPPPRRHLIPPTTRSRDRHPRLCCVVISSFNRRPRPGILAASD